MRFTEPAGIVPHLGREEAERRHQHYLGPEHLLLGLLVQGDSLAARVLRAHGLDLQAVRAGLDRLVDQGVLPGPQPSDAELLATIGIDLNVVYRSLKEAFGDTAYHYAAQRVRLRPTNAVPHAPMSGTPLICRRVFMFVWEEALVRGQDVTAEHWLLALLRDAEDPVDIDLDPAQRRLRSRLGLPNHGASPVRLLVEAQGLTLDHLRAAVIHELDRHQ